MTQVAPPGSREVEELLADQQDLSAVERFSRWHDEVAPDQREAAYARLMPLGLPAAGQQYAFAVELDKCSGCKACVSACHSLNGLDDGEAWRNTGLLVSDDWRQPVQQIVTTACHHCLEPGCLEGCPVLAYDKDPVTGIVKHLDDQCIGCQYCVMKCPYDVPKYSAARGIVRKCDLCSDRLAVGEAPACAQACPNEAIRISTVSVSALRAELTAPLPRPWLPSAPSPRVTLPTTRYLTARQLPPSLRAADRTDLRPEPAHGPLVIMLVLTQASVGMFLGGLWLREPAQLIAALAPGLAGLAASGLHLGRPLGAWRAFLGLRRSWLSREIVVFGAFATCAAAATALRLPVLVLAAGITGLAGVFCSVMVYADTHREYWNGRATAAKFFGTTALLGTTGTLAVALFAGAGPLSAAILAALAILSALVKLAADQRVLRHVFADDFGPLHKTALLLTGRFALADRLRATATIVGGIILPALIALLAQPPVHGSAPAAIVAALAAAIAVVGEITERSLFFRAVQPVRMPGGSPS